MIDLTAQLPSSPVNGNTSMAASNTISDQTGSMTAPGSESEQSAGVTVGTPGPRIPAAQPPTVLVHADSVAMPAPRITRGTWNNI